MSQQEIIVNKTPDIEHVVTDSNYQSPVNNPIVTEHQYDLARSYIHQEELLDLNPKISELHSNQHAKNLLDDLASINPDTANNWDLDWLQPYILTELSQFVSTDYDISPQLKSAQMHQDDASELLLNILESIRRSYLRSVKRSYLRSIR
jgi:hypothetical protein